jgi:FlaG/FlaF family flagellin (archaellin)
MRSSKTLLGAAVCVAALLLAAIPAKSQSQYNATGTVLGHVQDPSQAPVPGAKVTLRNEQTGTTQAYTTGSVGDYIFIHQIPGTYDVTVEKAGFHTATTKGLILQVEQTLRQDFTLQIGEVKQEVTAQESRLSG